MTKEHLLKRWLPPLLIILAGVLAYWNSFDGVFVYDDLDSVRDNPHIRQLWPLSEAMSVPLWSSATTVDGRPLLSLTFALNHALFGPEPWGYHLVNLLIHLGAGLLLFGVVRHTLELPRFRERYMESGTWLALVVALIWLVHPLQTESVTYIVQRAESLMGMFFLMTLYCAIRAFAREEGSVQCSGVRGEGGEERPTSNHAERGKHPIYPAQAGHPTSKGEEKGSDQCSVLSVQNRWFVGAVVACALGMGVKQTMFAAPILVLLYDGVFISESFRSAIKKRKVFYLALCSTWLIVFGIIGATWKESTIDFVKISPIRYLMTQPLVLLNYLRLSVWPSPLVLVYGWRLEEQWYRIVFPGMAILGMLGVMIRGLWLRRWYGFVIAWFFLILAPTSSIAPTRQAICEHRIYLSLAALVVFAVMGAEYIIRKLSTASEQRALVGRWLAGSVLLAFGCLTHIRNTDYHSELGIWQANVLDRPEDPMSHVSLGNALQELGRGEEATPYYREALRLDPGYAEAHYNWGVALKREGKLQEAMAHYRQALKRKPEHVETLNNLGHALHAVGRSREAVEYCREALRISPDLVEAHFNLGNALQALGQSREAIGQYQQALRVKPDCAEAYAGWGNVLLASGNLQGAIGKYQEALRIKPRYAQVYYHWGMALEAAGQPQEAAEYYRATIRIKPEQAEAHLNLGNTMLALGRPREAISHYQRALQIRPDYAHAKQNISIALEQAAKQGAGGEAWSREHGAGKQRPTSK